MKSISPSTVVVHVNQSIKYSHNFRFIIVLLNTYAEVNKVWSTSESESCE